MGKLRLRKFNNLTKTTQVVKERVGTRTSVYSFLLWSFYLTDSWRWSACGMVLYWFTYITREDMQRGLDGKESACSAGDPGLIPRSGRSPGEGNSNPLQYCCLENSIDRGTWRATVQRATIRHDWVTNTHTRTHTHSIANSRLACVKFFMISSNNCKRYNSAILFI